MCLLTPKGSRKIAEDDIHVYKIVRYAEDHDHWHGLIYRAGFKFNEVAETYPPDETEMHHMARMLVSCGKGFLHSYTDLEEARLKVTALNLYRENLPKEYFLCEAVIPKGSIYYTGDDTTMLSKESMAASNKLIVYKPKSK
jgi:hypothetical protein